MQRDVRDAIVAHLERAQARQVLRIRVDIMPTSPDGTHWRRMNGPVPIALRLAKVSSVTFPSCLPPG